jgi:phosphate transport system substrate-binding protein
MNRRNFLVTVIASGGALVSGSAINAGGFHWHLPGQAMRSSLLMVSTGSMFDLCQLLRDEYKNQNSLIDLIIEKGDSLQGIIAAKRGAIDLAAISRELSAEEDDATSSSFLIARSNISIIVHPDSPIKKLTQDQVTNIFSGKVTNWQQVGGDSASINIVSRKRGSNTRKFLEDVVLSGGEITQVAREVDSTRQLAATVAKDIHAIGYIAAKNDSGDAVVSSINVDGIVASHATVLSGRYPYTNSFYLLIAGEHAGIKFDFIKFVRSPEGQALVTKAGFVAVC